jgi:orotate phosphoribosyltransferase
MQEEMSNSRPHIGGAYKEDSDMNETDILGMKRDELLALDPEAVNRILTKEEILHIFSELGGFWGYDYEAGRNGRPGFHALLKSRRHSDGFINSKVVLCHGNIRKIFAKQVALKFSELGLPRPHFVAGIPEGATELGKDVAEMLGSEAAEMEKIVEGDKKVIKMRTNIKPEQQLLLVEDFCTRGTGFTEAVRDINSITHNPSPVMPYEIVIINRGGLKEIDIEDIGTYAIIPLAEHRINDWDPESEECPLCKLASRAIKPKDPLENWELLMNSQK